MPYGKCYRCGSAYCSNDCDIPENDIDDIGNAGTFTMECTGGSKCECDYYNESE